MEEAKALVELALAEAEALQAASPLPHALSMPESRMPGVAKVAASVETGFGLMLGALEASEQAASKFDAPSW